jgi:hypothetical protein
MMGRLALIVVLVFEVGFPHFATAHTLSESLSAWQIEGNTIHLQFTVPDLESRRLVDSETGAQAAKRVGAYLVDHVGASAAGMPCTLSVGPRQLTSTPGYSRFDFGFTCPSPVAIKIHSFAFFDLVKSHTNFARIQNNGRFFEQVFTINQPEADAAEGSEGPLHGAGFATYVRMGILHIFTGVDHMSFMLGLVLISRRVRDLLFVVTGFTLGHSLTLALAVTGVVRPDVRFIDALVALTIALIGAEIAGDSTHRPAPYALVIGGMLTLLALAKLFGARVGLPTALLLGSALFAMSYLMLTGQLRDAGRVRLVVTFVFGLSHGFGFASNLLEMRLPAEHLAALLVGFNIGVELGQVTLVLGSLLIARLWVRAGVAMPRPLFTDLASAFLVGEGLCWFLSRSMALA